VKVHDHKVAGATSSDGFAILNINIRIQAAA